MAETTRPNHQRGAEPAYQVLAGELREQILEGAFPPTRRLPTDAELSAAHGVSRQTVRHAFDELVGEGLVYRVRGRGSFAVGSPSRSQYLRSLGSIDDLLALADDTDLEVIEPLAETIDVAAAGRLRLASDAVYAGTYRRLHGGMPLGLTRVYLPPKLGQTIAADPRAGKAGTVSASTIIALVDKHNDSPIVHAHQSISAAIVDSGMGALIDCPAGSPALLIDRLYLDAQGSAVELAISTFNVQRYSYRLELRRSVR